MGFKPVGWLPSTVCRLIPRRPPTRIAEVATRRLVEKFSSGEPTVSVDAGDVVVRLGSDSYVLDREDAARLRDDLGDALTHRREFLHTAGGHREDGSYVVERRGADSSGHRKVFDSFRRVERLYERLPKEFTADEVGRTGLTGGRRHMLVRHFAEHPAFECDLASRQPLTARKRDLTQTMGGEHASADAV
jgi:hypothetical protein